MYIFEPEGGGLNIDSILQGLESADIMSGRNALYVLAEARRDMPVTWHHFIPEPEWHKVMSSAVYRIWRLRGFP